MKKISFIIITASSIIALTGCGASKSTDLQSNLQNPLYAEQYYDAQVENMVNLLIGSGELLRDPSIKKAIDDARIEGLRLAKAATDIQSTGKIGAIASDTEEARGEVLLINGSLYTGPEFRIWPGVDVRLYLSTVIDPRDVTFPDETAIEIGRIHTAFGSTSYDVSAALAKTEGLRTVVFYDAILKRMLGFAQL